MKQQKLELHIQWNAHCNQQSFHPLCHLGWWTPPMLHCGQLFSLFLLFLSKTYFCPWTTSSPVITWPPSINKAAPPIVAHITPFTTQLPTYPIEICSRHPTCHNWRGAQNICWTNLVLPLCGLTASVICTSYKRKKSFGEERKIAIFTKKKRKARVGCDM